MRTMTAIFARGSCRALKWTALFGVMLAMGAGQAAAQAAPTMYEATADESVVTVTTDQAVYVGERASGLFSVAGTNSVSNTVPVGKANAAMTFMVTFPSSVTLDGATMTYTQPTAELQRIKTGLGSNTDMVTHNVVITPDALSFDATLESYVWEKDVAIRTVTLPEVKDSDTTNTYTYALTPAPPAGLTWTAGDRTITGTPTVLSSTKTYTYTGTRDGATAFKATGTFTIAIASEPGAPTGLTVTAVSSSELQATWTAPAETGGSPLTRYIVQYQEKTSPASNLWNQLDISPASTTAVIPGLKEDTLYSVTVTAANGVGWGPKSATVDRKTMAPAVPDAPILLEAMPGNKSVTLKWRAAMGPVPTSYEFEQDSGTWMPAGSATSPLEHKVTGLTNGQAYAFRVRGRNAAGHGSPSNIMTATPMPPPAQGIKSVSIGNIGEGGMAQATVILTGAVPEGQFVRVKLRLVGEEHTRVGVNAAAVSAPHDVDKPSRPSGGLSTPLTGELDYDDYDAQVASELTIQGGEDRAAVTVSTRTDDDAEDEVLLLQAIPYAEEFNNASVGSSTALGALKGKEKLFAIMDSHTQGYALTAVPAMIYEAGNLATVSTLHFTPNYRRVDDQETVFLSSSHEAYQALFADGNSFMKLPTGAGGVTAQFQLHARRRPVPQCACDGDRMDDDVVVSASIGGTVVATTTITVVDVHKLPEITVTAMTTTGMGPLPELAEGVKYKVKVEANRNKPSGQVTPETVKVELKLADESGATADDYRITPASVLIIGGRNDQSKTFDLEVLSGDGDVGAETLVLNAMVTGTSVPNGGGTENKGMLSVDLVDKTTLNVEPKTDAEVKLAVAEARNESEGADGLWTAGDDALSIMLGELFTLPATGFGISADANSADAKVAMAEADSGMVTVKAIGPGTTTVTVTTTTTPTSASTQVSANVAIVEFEVMVDKMALVLTLTGPSDMNVPEGKEAMLTVTANQELAEDLEVSIMRDRSKSTADEDDFEVGALMIKAGEMSGTTMVKAVEDNMAEDMEELVLYAMAGDTEVGGEVMLYLWDAAVPALPIIAQLLLAGVLGVGGYRRYRRR